MKAISRIGSSQRLAATRSLRVRSIWGDTGMEGEPLTIPLNVESPVPTLNGTTPTRVTTLANGLKIASSDMVAACTTVGIYIDGGSAQDTVSGTAHLLQHMAFKSSDGRSAVGMVRDAENLGAVATGQASRENIVFQVDTLRESVPTVLDMLAETTLAPKLLPWEVDEQKTAVSIELEEFNGNHQALVQELMHPAAFGSHSPLGKPLMTPKKSMASLTPAVLSDYISKQFTPDKMVVTAAGNSPPAHLAPRRWLTPTLSYLQPSVRATELALPDASRRRRRLLPSSHLSLLLATSPTMPPPLLLHTPPVNSHCYRRIRPRRPCREGDRDLRWTASWPAQGLPAEPLPGRGDARLN